MDGCNTKCGSKFCVRARSFGKIWASPSQNSPRGMFNFISATCQHHMRDFIDMDECNAKCGSKFCVRARSFGKIWASPSQNSPRGMFNFLSASCQHHMRDFIDIDECNAKCGSRFCARALRLERSGPPLHRTFLAECSTSSLRPVSIICKTS